MKNKKASLFFTLILIAFVTFLVGIKGVKETISWSGFFNDLDEFSAKQTIFYIVYKQNDFFRVSQSKEYGTFLELCSKHKDFDQSLCKDNPSNHGYTFNIVLSNEAETPSFVVEAVPVDSVKTILGLRKGHRLTYDSISKNIDISD